MRKPFQKIPLIFAIKGIRQIPPWKPCRGWRDLAVNFCETEGVEEVNMV